MARGKHTHTGECQVCGARQAISNDGRQWIAKHGYSVEHGFFDGTCWGSDAQPIELSKDLLDEAIRRVEAQREGQRTWRKNVEAMSGTLQGWHYVPFPKDDPLYGLKDHQTLFGEYFEEFTLFANQKDGYNKTFFRTTDGKKYDPAKEGYYYSSATEAAKITQERTLKSIDVEISQMTRYIEWQTERKKKWKVQQLQPVKHEPPRPVFEKGMVLELPGRKIRYLLTKAKHALGWGGRGRNPRVVGWFAEDESNKERRFYLTNKELKGARVVPKGKQ